MYYIFRLMVSLVILFLSSWYFRMESVSFLRFRELYNPPGYFHVHWSTIWDGLYLSFIKCLKSVHRQREPLDLWENHLIYLWTCLQELSQLQGKSYMENQSIRVFSSLASNVYEFSHPFTHIKNKEWMHSFTCCTCVLTSLAGAIGRWSKASLWYL